MGAEVAGSRSEHRSQEPHVSCRQSAERVLSVRFRAPAAELATSVEAVLQRLMDHLRAQDAVPAGTPFIAYHEFADGYADLEVGIPVAESVRGDGEIQVGSLPMGRYLTMLHRGTEAALHDFAGMLAGWLERHHEQTDGPLYVTVAADGTQANGDPGPCVFVQRRIMAGKSCRPPSRGRQSAATDAVMAGAADAIAQLPQNLPTAPPRAMSLRPIQSATARLMDALLERRGTMHVDDAMTREVHTCGRAQSLQEAAQLLWEHDIGALPVVDEERRPIGMITDRDICMAAYTQGRRLAEIGVASAMSPRIYVCRSQDLLGSAEQTMAAQQVRRLPVVNDKGALTGMLSMNDIVLARTRTPLHSAAERLLGDVTQTLAAISQHRSAGQHASAQTKRAVKNGQFSSKGESP